MQHSHPRFGIFGGYTQSSDSAPDLLFCRGSVWVQEAARPKRLQQHGCETFEFGCGSRGRGSDSRCRFRFTHDLVQAYRNRLSEIHRDAFARGNAQQPVAMTEIGVQQAALLRAEKQGDTASGKIFPDSSCCVLEAMQRVIEFPIARGSRANHERAIGDGIRDRLEHPGSL